MKEESGYGVLDKPLYHHHHWTVSSSFSFSGPTDW